MRLRFLASVVAAVLAVAGLTRSPASAAVSSDSSCSSGYCAWSGANFTGTKADLQSGLNVCFTAGLDAIRSAQVIEDAFYVVFYDNADCTGSSSVLNALTPRSSEPSFDPPKQSMKMFLNQI